MCGIRIEHDGSEILSIRGNPEDPFSRGYHCIKAEALADLHNDPDRLRKPLRKRGGDWEEISWEDAWDESADRIKSIQKKHCNDAVGLYLGNPNVHNYGTLLFGLGFLRSLSTKNRFSATSIDQLPHQMVGRLMFGHQLLIPVPDIDRTDYLLMLGANPVVSRGSIMTAPDVGVRLREICNRGGRFVVVDPRRTETAQLASEHVFIKPGTDAAFLAAIIATIIKAGKANPGDLLQHAKGFERVCQEFSDISLDDVACYTGVAKADIERIAFEFVERDRAVCYGRMGVSTQKFGALCQWMITVLNFITGNLDAPGGAMFTRPAFDFLPSAPRGSFAKHYSRVRKLASFGGEFPVATMADEMLTPGQGQIRGFVSVAGNPVLTTPNGQRLDLALSQLEFMLSLDTYINETTRHADIILPATSALEHDNYDVAFNILSVKNTAAYSPALFDKPSTSYHDWESMLELEMRLRSVDAISSAKAKAKYMMLKALRPEGLLAMGLRFGPWGAKFGFTKSGLSLRRLRQHPAGIDLGPLLPELPKRLFTTDKKISLCPEPYLKDLPRLYQDIETEKSKSIPSQKPLLLIGRRLLKSNNSWIHNSPRIARGRSLCTALINPHDAKARGITTGCRIDVSTSQGCITIEAVVTGSIMPGTISIPHGFGHTRPGVKMSIAKTVPGVSVNDVTSQDLICRLSGNAVVNGVPVQVERATD